MLQMLPANRIFKSGGNFAGQSKSSAMRENATQIPLQAERDEFDAVAEAFARSPRLATLLDFIGERYFAGESDQLTEYNIATEVFGRSKMAFDASEDAIARVEAHRLRKGLKKFYEGPGKDHNLQLSIPPGTYIPVFTHKAVVDAPSSPPLPAEQANRNVLLPFAPSSEPRLPDQDRSSLPAVSPPARSRNGLYALLALVLACLIVAAAFVVSRARTGAAKATASRRSESASPARPVGSVPPATVPLRLLAGYSGQPQTDGAGAIWEADRYVHGGGPWRRPEGSIARTSDPLIFEQWRSGDFSYDIPLRPGVYELHLYFVTSESSSDALSTFTVKINGNPVLSGFDVNSDALGPDIADERIFRDVSPGSDGMLHIGFNSERGAPLLNALEVLPGIPHKQLPIRIVTQRASFTDHNGHFWRPDDYYTNGRISDNREVTVGSPDPDLFATERYGHFTYAIPVDTRDRYTLILHFVEFYFGPQAPGGGGIGSRLFRVMCNGQTLLDNFDIYKEAGSLHVLTMTFYHIRPSPQGKLNLTFEPIVNNATVSGIEVLDESQ
jgi:hypothetical protein